MELDLQTSLLTDANGPPQAVCVDRPGGQRPEVLQDGLALDREARLILGGDLVGCQQNHDVHPGRGSHVAPDPDVGGPHLVDDCAHGEFTHGRNDGGHVHVGLEYSCSPCSYPSVVHDPAIGPHLGHDLGADVGSRPGPGCVVFSRFEDVPVRWRELHCLMIDVTFGGFLN